MLKGNLKKMDSVIIDNCVEYTLNIGDYKLNLNDVIGRQINITYLETINCIYCGVKTKQSFGQGYCSNCFHSLPQTDKNIMNPELDMAHWGISRDMEWSKKNSLIPHYVYLANTGEVKIGVTRNSQIPTRWIDQGADNAIILAKTPNRHIAGTIEVYLKQFFNDRTKWKKMLSNKNEHINLQEEKDKAIELIHPEFRQYIIQNNNTNTINYPIKSYPEIILQNINLEKTKAYKGVLVGIKGQYLIFENGDVLNIRKHSGFLIRLDII